MSDQPIRSFSDPAADRFRAEVRAWLDQALPADWRRQELDRTEDELLDLRRKWDRQLYEAGYSGLSWPAEFGGRDGGPIMEVIFNEELARAHAPEGLGRIGRVMAGPLIMNYGTVEQRRRFLPGILDGSQVWCLGYSEPHAGSDLAAVTTTAVRDGDTYRISGRKTWTSHAHYADRCVLLVRSSADLPRHENISLIMLDLHQPGVHISPILTSTGDHHFNEVVFEDAIASIDDRVGAEHDGWSVFRGSLKFERGVTPALNHYIEMRRGLDVLTECCAAAETDPSAVALASALADGVEVVRWHVLRLSELEANGRQSRSAGMVLKLLWSQQYQRLADFGARVACVEHRDFWRYQYLQSRATTIYAGTTEIQKNTIGRQVIRDLAGRAL